MNKKSETRVRLEDRTLTLEEVRTALAEGEFTQEEELLIRMRYGVGLAPDEELEYRGQDNEETRIKLALIEKSLLDELDNSNRDPLESLLKEDA